MSEGETEGREPRPEDRGDPGRSMLGTLKVVGTLVAPTTLVVALLYYFGWARTSRQAQVMGLDESLFGFSAQDYILRSITSMFWPLFIAAVAILLGVLVHARLMAGHKDSAVKRVIIGLGVAGAILLVLGLVGSADERPSRLISLGAPLAITIGIAALAYAWYLRRLPSHRGARSDEPSMGLAWSLITVLLLLSAFWTVSHYAAIKGIDFAREAERQLPYRPSVIIYSPTRLHLEPPIVEDTLPGDEAAYRFKYSGLKLLFRADDKLFLRPEDTTVMRNVILPEDIGIRIELE